MCNYRRTIITIDDTQTQKDYMLFCVFEKLWPDMQSAQSAALHKTKSIDTAKHFDVGVHVDEVTIHENVVDDPLPHVKLKKSVEMLWGKMYRDPDWGIDGFLLKNGHNDIDSVTELLPQTQSIQQVWGWFDVQRKMYDYLKANNIKLERIGVFTKKWLGFDLSEHPLHVGCIYVVHYSPIKAVHIETVPMMPAVRCEIDWRDPAFMEDVFVKVTERVTDKKSEPNVFSEKVAKGNKFALVKMSSSPMRIDIDITNGKGDTFFFLRSIMFLSINPIGKSASKKPSVQRKRAIGLEHYLRPAILEKDAIMREKNMEFVFFDGDPNKKEENKKNAKDCVKRMIAKANKKVIIADPYFTRVQFDEYIAPLLDTPKEYVIINCKDQLAEAARWQQKTSQEIEDEITQCVAGFNNNSSGCHVVFFIIQGQGRLHDRFVLADEEGWLIGSSLGEFGGRACSIVKLTDSAHMKLAELLSLWCNNRSISNIIE